MNHPSLLRTLPWAVLLTAIACSGATTGGSSGSSSGGFGSGTSTGGAMSSGSAGSGSVSSGVSSGAGGSTGATSGAGGSTGATSGAVGSTGATSGAASTGATSGASSTGASAGASSGSASSGAVTGNGRHGKSAGCGMAPVGAVSTGFTNHKITIPACNMPCTTTGPINPDCICAAFATGGPSAKTNAGEDFTNRDYSIELPANYNPMTPYPVFYGGGGCGGNPPQNGDGFNVGETGTIKVGLSYVSGCFADGGNSCSGPGPIANCHQGPELPYFRTVLKEVESRYCVDVGNVFVGGYSSGGWEAFTLGCGAADLVRGFVSDEGGKRETRPPCMGPVAALMVAGLADTINPIGPLAALDKNLDSFGSAPGRDEILMRNGCTGTATAPYDPAFPACVKYTGCPAAYPVVWCPLPGAGHNNSSYNGVNYSGGSGPMWKFLSTLPPAP